MIWKPLKHPMIVDGYLISNKGYIRNKDCDESDYLIPDYHSSNGYDFIMLIVKEKYRINNSLFMLFPIDELLGITFIPIPTELKDKPITIKHINCDTRDIDLSNLEWIEDIEEWRDCTYPGVKPGMYEVSSWGRVRNKKYMNIIKPQPKSGGYLNVSLGSYDERHRFSLHRLIAYQFLNWDSFNRYAIINHINGIKIRNTWKNLEIVSQKQNVLHSINTKLFPSHIGENNSRAILTEKDVHDICSLLLKYNGNVKQVISSLNKRISESLVYGIRDKKTWCFISDKYFNKGFFSNRITENDIHTICRSLLHNNFKQIAVYNELKDTIPNISLTKIHRIHKKKYRRDITDQYF